MPTYRIYNVDGSSEVREEEANIDFLELQALVGGYFEPLPSPEVFGIKTSGIVMVDEEGRLKGLPVNPHFHAIGGIFPLVGNVVIIEGQLPEKD
jgi:hypothetical protein